MKNNDACVNSDELGCLFTKVERNGKPALLVCANIQAHTSASEPLSALLYHAKELNVRLPFLRASIRAGSLTASSLLASIEEDISHQRIYKASDEMDESNSQEGYLFVLHGFSQGSITACNISHLLDRLAYDFKVFLDYANAHSIRIQPGLVRAAVKPFA